MFDFSSLVDPILHAIVSALVAAFAGAVVWLLGEVIKFVRAKAAMIGLTISATQEAELLYKVRASILESEEKVEAWVKLQTGPMLTTAQTKASVKLQEALEGLIRRVPALAMDSVKATALIQQELAAMPLGASKTGGVADPFVR